MLGPQEDGWALVVLTASAATDWLDGKLARLLNQYSRLGALLDPVADRLYILATLFAFVVRGILPWWVAALIVGRDIVLALALPVMRRHGYGPFEVHYLGKAATFCLLYALPLLLLAQLGEDAASPSRRPRRAGVHRLGHPALPVGGRALPRPGRLGGPQHCPSCRPTQRADVRSVTGV